MDTNAYEAGTRSSRLAGKRERLSYLTVPSQEQCFLSMQTSGSLGRLVSTHDLYLPGSTSLSPFPFIPVRMAMLARCGIFSELIEVIEVSEVSEVSKQDWLVGGGKGGDEDE